MNRRNLLVLMMAAIHAACRSERPQAPRARRPTVDDGPIPWDGVPVTGPELGEPLLSGDPMQTIPDPGLPEAVPGAAPEQAPANPLALAGLRIALDVGHGRFSSGFEQGASNGSVIEYRLNLEQANHIAANLRQQGAQVTILNYAENHPNISLVDRGARAANHHLFISLHHNAFGDAGVQGTEVLVEAENLTDDDKILAQFINNAMVQRIGYPNRGLKIQSLGVLRGAPRNVVKCLTEPFFITASGVSPAIAQQKSRAAADGIVAGIIGYWAMKQSPRLLSYPVPEVSPNDLPGLYDDHADDT
jgi:N-acetylmuramoyl-L-alanine amidase